MISSERENHIQHKCPRCGQWYFTSFKHRNTNQPDGCGLCRAPEWAAWGMKMIFGESNEDKENSKDMHA